MNGVVLEGGAMRGLFTAGVLDWMMQAGLRADGMVGVSAGAAFGCNYKSGKQGRVLRYNQRFCRDHRYCSVRSWVKTGDLFGADFCYRRLPEELDPFDWESFERNPMEFFMVCTDIVSGKAVYRQCDRNDGVCFEWLRASASMPLVSRIVEIDGGKYLDGALADAIPLRFFESRGYNRNLVILTRPAGYRKKLQKGIGLLKRIYREYPELLKLLETRHQVYNETVDYIESRAKTGDVLLIRPESPLPVKRITHDPLRLQQTWAAGYAQAEKQSAELREFFAEKG